MLAELWNIDINGGRFSSLVLSGLTLESINHMTCYVAHDKGYADFEKMLQKYNCDIKRKFHIFQLQNGSIIKIRGS